MSDEVRASADDEAPLPARGEEMLDPDDPSGGWPRSQSPRRLPKLSEDELAAMFCRAHVG